ncbi:hypothetical protein EYM_00630 [Ignicoccus islandicus DSM 13165]|uniref:Serine/threonine specific protein phosphatases domain-containing protein n=1 Tax=Ignicoccus islandicus DSM 13165 TaxID=940295 RepID=A0A0U3FP74_9CREN|nr:metallophosphoesterase family protein [Ignicoccus islandicus]ALU12127.1 hypothetical protein EYM_00630 [Ignicoccus islandicus DSM 13165]
MELAELPVDDAARFAEAVNSLKPDELIELLEEAKKLLLKMYEGGVHPVAFTYPDTRYVFHGDLYGSFIQLYDIWERLGKREVFEEWRLVFLGNYVDRGPKQVEALLLPLALKAKRPRDVIILRGNHEAPKGMEPLPHDFPLHLLKRYGKRGEEIYVKAREVFDAMPLALIVDRSVVAFHGGPSTLLIRKGCKSIECVYSDKVNENYLIEEYLWNDPAEMCSWEDEPEDCWSPNPVGKGFLWGPGVTRYFLRETKTKFIVRGNYPADGVKLFHRNKVVSVFTRTGVPFLNRKFGAWSPNFLEQGWDENPTKWKITL